MAVYLSILEGNPLVRVKSEKCTGIIICCICHAYTSPCSAFFFTYTGIAKHFRYGSQEDSHEFLRYTVDAMQKSCLPGTK